jgi:hypothetical protein
MAQSPEVRVMVLVPFRDADPRQHRAAQLERFMGHMPAVLDAAFGPGKWGICVADDTASAASGATPAASAAAPFCRGRLLNAAFLLAAWRWPAASAVILHDVDLLPDAARLTAANEHMAFPPPLGTLVALNSDSPQYARCAQYCGGIALLSTRTFVAANGFQNGFLGWGGEDDSFRDAVAALAAKHGVGRWFHAPTAGRVVDVEWEAAQVAASSGAPPPYRCAEDPAAKMDREARRTIKARAKAVRFADHGLAQAAFAVTAKPRVMGGHPHAVLESVDVLRALPPGWVAAMSRSTGRPYYVNAASRTVQYAWPP